MINEKTNEELANMFKSDLKELKNKLWNEYKRVKWFYDKKRLRL